MLRFGLHLNWKVKRIRVHILLPMPFFSKETNPKPESDLDIESHNFAYVEWFLQWIPGLPDMLFEKHELALLYYRNDGKHRAAHIASELYKITL
ncbi:hypothetical protein CHISP_2656 [Chitinispirillum alkaliphilum]|nr:hypothetical protein CHISP_2656 [Chitinispirillum alkaliphilum]